MMGAPSWNRVKEVIEAALDCAPDERGAFVRRECGEDGALRASFTVPAADAADGDFALAVGGLLLELPAPDDSAHGPWPEADRDPEPFRPVVEQLAAYFEGTRTEFELPLAPAGTGFQRRVWDALRQIPYGRTASYGQVAASIGAPGAARAVRRAARLVESPITV